MPNYGRIVAITKEDPDMAVAYYAAEPIAIGQVLQLVTNQWHLADEGNVCEHGLLGVALNGCTQTEIDDGAQESFITGVVFGKGTLELAPESGAMAVGATLLPDRETSAGGPPVEVGIPGNVVDEITAKHGVGNIRAVGIMRYDNRVEINTMMTVYEFRAPE